MQLLASTLTKVETSELEKSQNKKATAASKSQSPAKVESAAQPLPSSHDADFIKEHTPQLTGSQKREAPAKLKISTKKTEQKKKLLKL